MDKKPLILVGGGGHCKSVIDVAESAGYTILGILDKPEEVGKQVLDYKVIGTDYDIPQYVDKVEFVITVGQIKSSALRHKIAERIEKAGGKYATIIASDATVSKYAAIGEGTVVLHKCVVNADAKIGKNCIINTMANIEHEVEIGDFCHVSTGVMVNGCCKVGNEVFLGSQSILTNGIEVGNNNIIGAGSVVTKDVPAGEVWVGNPAKYMKKVEQNADNKPVTNLMGGGRIVLPVYAAYNRIAA